LIKAASLANDYWVGGKEESVIICGVIALLLFYSSGVGGVGGGAWF